MYQYFVVEIQTAANGTVSYLVHQVSDDNPDTARMQAESTFHQVLAAAAISQLPAHAAIMFTSEGFPVMNQCYKH